MKKYKIAVWDEYQKMWRLESADLSVLRDRADITNISGPLDRSGTRE